MMASRYSIMTTRSNDGFTLILISVPCPLAASSTLLEVPADALSPQGDANSSSAVEEFVPEESARLRTRSTG